MYIMDELLNDYTSFLYRFPLFQNMGFNREFTMKIIRRMSLLLLCFGLVACDPPSTSTPPPEVPCWWDQPLTNSSYANLDPIPFTFHCASFTGIENMQVSVNGIVEAVISPVQTGSGGSEYGTLFLGEYAWTPPAFGTYSLEVRGKKSGAEYGPPIQIQVFIEQALTMQEAPEQIAMITLTPSTIPTSTPTLEMAQAELSVPSFSTEKFYYRLGGCGPMEITIRTEGDHPDLYSVVLFYRLQDTASDDRTEWTAVAMNPTADGAFTRTINSESDIPDFALFTSAFFQVQIVATDSEQNEVARTGVFGDAVLELCSTR